MSAYTIQGEAARIFHSVLLTDERLEIPDEVRKLARETSFDPYALSEPFLPAPVKCAESSAALWALLGTFGNAIIKQRHGITQSCIVSSNVASLFLFSFLLLRVGGKSVVEDRALAARYAVYDLTHQMTPYRRLVTNLYPTRDGRWFHLHGGLDSDRSLRMLGLPPTAPLDVEDGDEMEVINLLTERVARFDARWLDIEANEYWRQAGTICLTHEEYRASEQGKAVADEPLYTLEEFPSDSLPPVPWPAVHTHTTTFRPLEGIKVLDLTRAIAGPTIARLAALFGATVLRVSNTALPDLGMVLFESNLGKRDAHLDLKTDKGREALRALIQDADVVLDGYRPGALERLGFGPEYVREMAERRGRGIVYARENCYGWKGPWQHRSGWQQISDAVTGIACLFGRMWGRDEPVMPFLPNSDFQTGIVGCIGIMAALDRRSRKGGSYLVSTSLNQLNSFLISLGTQAPEIQRSLRERWPEMSHFRYYDDLHRQMRVLVSALPRVAPELFQPKNFQTIKANLGVPDEDMIFLGPAVTYDTTELRYDSGSCMRGTHKPEWPGDETLGA
ncbi:CAIB/BAIF family enzyme [Xylaria arbuscula]|nr:CAIB/BAIF family enzyme [Xylaria arbuscula]